MNAGMPIPDAALAALEATINRYLALDPEGAARITDLQGKVILIEVAGFDTRLYLIPGPAGVHLYGDYAGTPDCVLRAAPLALARLGVSRRKEDRLFSGEVQVEGDTHLAQAFGDFLSGLEVDWEEQLARLVGDVAAHRIGSQVRAAGHWRRRTADTLTEDVKEYLQEEARLLPSRYEVQAFLDEVDRVRDGVERLAARIERLAQRRNGSTSER
ncbi:ubiquinone biosynthesis accessory factor UbiJ [Candidatus Thiosymbion oneisti]|uniref:ubiquinone biosynthesis accessory factor UbiJ n=1 Tax=Candidatus Thiosymbion oneisti TaxID=589554 RepID=UPI000B7D1FB8|nr:SCP2 sterol-binding domain-containing protein [Candidatus Thiosymbion oneisti]